jgi:hypothetical protein
VHAFLNASNQIEVIQRCVKIAWPSRQIARKVLGEHGKPTGLTRSGNGTLQVYKCRICRGWHVGHLNHRTGTHLADGPMRDDL